MTFPPLTRNILATAVALGSATVATAAFSPSAAAFTLTYDSYFGSTNTPGTGASAQVDFTFTDQADGSVLLTLDVENTTGGGSLFNQAQYNTDLSSDLSSGDAGYVNTGESVKATFTGFGFDLTSDFDAIDFDYLSGGNDFFGNFYDGNSFLSGNASGVDGGGITNGQRFDIGLGLKGNDARGIGDQGNVSSGLKAGMSTTLQFSLTSSNALDAAALEQALENAFQTNSLAAGARFKQTDNGGSDKLGGGILVASPIPEPEPPKPVSVPEPSLVLGVGLVGAALLKRKKNQGASALASAGA